MRNVTRIERPEQGENVGEKIKYVRTKLGISQTELANRLGRQRPEITMFETGARTVDIYTLRDIAKICNVSTDYLLGVNDFESADINEIAINQLTGLSEKAIKNLIYLKKYYNGYLIPTINYLIEQEQMFIDNNESTLDATLNDLDNENIDFGKIYDMALKISNGNSQNKNRILGGIHNYFKAKTNETLYITNDSLKKENEFNDNIEKTLLTKEFVYGQEIIDSVLLRNIERLLEQAKHDLNENKRDEE